MELVSVDHLGTDMDTDKAKATLAPLHGRRRRRHFRTTTAIVIARRFTPTMLIAMALALLAPLTLRPHHRRIQRIRRTRRTRRMDRHTPLTCGPTLMTDLETATAIAKEIGIVIVIVRASRLPRPIHQNDGG